MDELRQILQKIRRRYRWIDTAWMGQRTLWLPAAAMLLVQLLGRVLPLENLRLWTWLPLGVWLVVLPAFSLLRRFTLLRAARRADEDLGLYERLSSALELELAVNNPGQAFPAELLQAQRGDALISARAIDPRRDLPFSWLRRPLITAAVLGLLTVLSIFIPNPMDDVLEQRRAVARAAAEQADRIEALQQNLAQNPSLTPEEQQELARQLEELVDAAAAPTRVIWNRRWPIWRAWSRSCRRAATQMLPPSRLTWRTWLLACKPWLECKLNPTRTPALQPARH